MALLPSPPPTPHTPPARTQAARTRLPVPGLPVRRQLPVLRLLRRPGLRVPVSRLRAGAPGRLGIAVQPEGIRAGQHQREPEDPGLEAQHGRQRLVQGIGHPARDQHDQPAHELDDGERAVAHYRLHDPGRDEQEEPEQDGQPVQPARPDRDPDGVIRILQRERRIRVSEEDHVPEHPGLPAHEAGQVVGRKGGQPPGEQGGEPADDHDHVGGDGQRPQHDEVRDGHQESDEYSQS